jgi:hypothetical protein
MNYVLRLLLLKALGIDWGESARATAWYFIRLWCQGFFGMIFSMILAFRIGVLFDLQWAIEADIAEILRRLNALDPEVIGGFKMIGSFGALFHIVLATMFGPGRLENLVRHHADDSSNATQRGYDNGKNASDCS